MGRAQPIEVVRIRIEKRAGSIYVSSADVPGLWLWGKDPERVFKNIAPAIQTLYKYNRGMDVEVRETFVSKLLRWFLARLLRETGAASQSDAYRIYPAHHNPLTGAHG